MRIPGDKVVRSRMQIREIAAAAARDQNLFANAIRAFEHQNSPSALAGLDGAH